MSDSRASVPEVNDPTTETLPADYTPTPRQEFFLPAIGQELGPVRLVSELGRGGMGVVYLGHHRLLDRSVAVKCIPCAGPTRFVEEAKAAAAVRHPRLTEIYHADMAGDTAYLVMQFVDGPTLGQVVAKTGGLKVGQAIAVMSDVAAAVAELHDHDIVHRDLKASNVLMDREGNAFVTDFGLAVRKAPAAVGAGTGAGGAEGTMLAGTPGYMAPEMFEGRLSPRSDTYALGVLLFQMLTGRLPYHGSFEEMRRHHESTPLPVEALRERGVDAGLIELIERAAHKQFMFRHKTGMEFLRALKQFAGDVPRARKELPALILASSGEQVVSPDAPTVEKPPSTTTTYAETISRAVAQKRERMRAVASGSDDAQPARAGDTAVPVQSTPVAFAATDLPPAAPEPPQKLEIAIVLCVAVLVMVILGAFLWWLLA